MINCEPPEQLFLDNVECPSIFISGDDFDLERIYNAIWGDDK